MNSISKLLLVAAAMFAFATVALIGSPAKTANAQDVNFVKVCEGDVGDGPFLVDLSVVGGAELVADAGILGSVTLDFSDLEVQLSLTCTEGDLLDLDEIDVNVEVCAIIVGCTDFDLSLTLLSDSEIVSGALEFLGVEFEITLDVSELDLGEGVTSVLSGDCAGGVIVLDLLNLDDLLCTITNTADDDDDDNGNGNGDDEPSLQEIIALLLQIQAQLNNIVNTIENDLDLDLDNELISEIINEIVNAIANDVDVSNAAVAELLAELINTLTNVNTLAQELINDNVITLEDLVDISNALSNVNTNNIANELRLDNEIDVDNEIDLENEIENEIDNENELDNEIDIELKNELNNINELNNVNENINNNNNEQNQNQTNDQNVNVSTGDVNIGDDDDYKKRHGGYR